MELHLAGKWTLRAHAQKVVFVKRPNEKATHVWMKAFLWALYLPQYPTLKVEVSIRDRYKPDVIALADDSRPLFWGEAGETSAAKIRSVAKRYPDTHIAIAKWNERIDRHVAVVQEALNGLRRSPPVDVINFPSDAFERFVSRDGVVVVTLDDLPHVRLG